MQNYQRIIGNSQLQPDSPPPNLAIKTVVNSKTTLSLYQAVGVPGSWIYDSGKLTIYLLRVGRYVKSNINPIFPKISIIGIVAVLVEKVWEIVSIVFKH